MDTFNLLLQIFFIWGTIIGKIVLSGLIFSKSKNKGWLMLTISASVELFTKILSVGMSFWIREMVHLDDLTSYSTSAQLISTLLSIVYYAIALVGIYMIYSRIKSFLAKK